MTESGPPPQPMDPAPPSNHHATTSLTLGLAGWVLYLGQWCFDLTVGLLLSFATGGASAVCSTVLDFLPFVLWIGGIVSGHAALGRVKRSGAPGRGRAVWGLVLNYTGLLFILILIVLLAVLIAAGVGAGLLGKLFPFLLNTPGNP